MESLGQILSNRYFVIPPNQRGYSWSSPQLDDLVGDLKLAGSKAHYMGPIIVTRDPDGDLEEDNYTPTLKCILEDGQQRITSFFFLMYGLLQKFEEIDGTESVDSREIRKLIYYQSGGEHLRLKNDNKTLEACFSHYVTENVPLPSGRSAPFRALRAASNWSSKLFSELTRDECVRWKNRLLNQARFILVDLSSAGVDRYLTFDAINSRGLPLSQFDKIKNFCILIESVRTLGTSPEDQWYESIQELDRFSVGQRSSEEAFITELFNVFHNERVSQGEVHQKFVSFYRPLLENSDPVREGDFIGFVKLWKSYASSFGLMTTDKRAPHYGAECSADAGKWLDRLDNMDLPTITRPVMVTGHMTINSNEFSRLVELCEKYTFRVHGVMSRRKDKNSTGIIELANEILRTSKSLDYISKRVCFWLEEWASLKDVVTHLVNGDPKYYFDSKVSGWAYCYYFLYEYEVHISPTGVSPINWGSSKESKKSAQEHILPQEHRDGKFWESHWPDEMRAERYKHRLGNLVLTNGNSILGRKPFDLKLNDPNANYDFQCDAATNGEKKIAQYTNGTDWKEDSILKRELELMKFAIDRWSVPCCCDNGNIYLPEAFELISEKQLAVLKEDCVGNPDMSPQDESED